MSEEYKRGYRDGYRDAMNDINRSKPTQPVSTAGSFCNVCGISGLSNLVCYNPKCPTKVTCGVVS